MKRTYIFLAVAALIVVVAAAVFILGSQLAPAPTPTSTPQNVTVEIVDFAYVPIQLTLPLGSTVTWVNHGAENHTSTNYAARMGPLQAWHSGIMQPGQTYSFTFTQAGTYKYRCNLHSTIMLARIEITP